MILFCTLLREQVQEEVDDDQVQDQGSEDVVILAELVLLVLSAHNQLRAVDDVQRDLEKGRTPVMKLAKLHLADDASEELAKLHLADGELRTYGLSTRLVIATSLTQCGNNPFARPRREERESDYICLAH